VPLPGARPNRNGDKLSANPHRIVRGVNPEERVPPPQPRGARVTDEREQALHYAARLRGLSLVRSGDRYALVHYLVADASLDDIAAFLIADDGNAEPGAAPGDRRADLRAMLKAERALLGEIEQEQRKAGERGRERATTEAALAEIRRRIAELQTEMGHKDGP
jgi:hypothetical protein